MVGALALGILALSNPPLASAHSHNDYYRARPLLDALEAGFCSVEADVFLLDGELRVGHSLEETRPGKTLRSMYLEPLARRVRENGGRVHPGGPEFWLLVDVKADGERAWPAIRRELKDYKFMLAAGGRPGAVRVVVSGDRAVGAIVGDPERLAGIDGRFEDLPSKLSYDQMPMVSAAWTGFFKFKAAPLSEVERLALRSLVRRAHREGRRVRFWGAPDWPGWWQEALDAGVDLVNTDQPARFAEWLSARSRRADGEKVSY